MKKRSILAALLLFSGLFACKVRNTDSAVKGFVPLSLSPPKVLYHFGVYQYLRPYGKAPGDALAAKWNQIPSINNPPGGPYRSGFYLSQHPGYNEKYAAESLSSPEAGSPWLMTVTIKDECIDEGPAQRWFDFSNSEDFSGCDFGNGNTSSECLTRANDYLSSHNIGLVRDSWWPTKGFWYARDPKCVKEVDATPESVLEAAASVPEFWSLAPYTTDERRDVGMGTSYRPGEVSFAVLTRALLDVAKPNKELLKNIALTARKSDIPGLKGPLATLTDYAYSCAVASRGADLKQELEVFTDKIDQEVLGKEGLSFDKHIKNLVTVGLPKLRGACPAVAIGGGVASGRGEGEGEEGEKREAKEERAENGETNNSNRPVGSCPDGYIKVPGDKVYGTSDFCVMKYEAKDGAKSAAGGRPKVNINQNDAKSLCQSLGKGYHLITNPEWMTVATNIAGQGSNWSNRSVGNGQLNRGNSNTPAAEPATGEGNSAWNINRRTHTLSNGEMIWDLAGNVWEWVDYTGSLGSNGYVPSHSSHPFWNDSWSYQTQSIGKNYGDGGALLRGGGWYDGSVAGVFAAVLNGDPSGSGSRVGFRCALSNAE